MNPTETLNSILRVCELAGGQDEGVFGGLICVVSM